MAAVTERERRGRERPWRGRALRLLVTGPGRVRWPAARWAVSLLAVAGAALLVWSGVIHLQLWAEGYKDVSVIGPLFLAQGVVAIVLAAALAIFRFLTLMAVGAVTLLATAAGLLLAANGGIFGYTESLVVPDAQSSLVIEFAGAAVLALAALIMLVGRRGW